MIVTEILPTLKQLKRADKIRVMQFLVNEIAREEKSFFEPNAEHSIYSPYDSYEAAAVLRELLKNEFSHESYG